MPCTWSHLDRTRLSRLSSHRVAHPTSSLWPLSASNPLLWCLQGPASVPLVLLHSLTSLDGRHTDHGETDRHEVGSSEPAEV